MSRPRFKPTPENRKLVRSLAALGLRHEHMCEVIGIRSSKTLRKYFAEELKAGYAEAMGRVARVAYEMATSGKYPAMTMFWLKVHQQKLADPRSEDDAATFAWPGVETVFHTNEPKPEEELNKLEYLGIENGKYVYRHRSDAPEKGASCFSNDGSGTEACDEDF